MHVAIKGGHDATVSALLEHKGDLSVRDGTGATVWHEMVGA